MLRRGSAPTQLWSIAGLKAAGAKFWGPLTNVVTPQKLFLFLLFQARPLTPAFPRFASLSQIVYRRLLRVLYRLQVQVWRLVRKHDPQPYEQSVLGFVEPRLRMLSRTLVVAYALKSGVRVLIASGWNANPQLAKVLSDVVYCWYAGYFVDEAKRFFLPVWIPSLKADKRKGFIYNRSLSVLTWSICLLTVSEVISAYLRIPITSTLAFGGIGGLAIGLAGKDVLSNFFGGLMLLLAEPFIPGDMVTFQRGGVRCEGRVERVGWYQTRLRGRDTRPTYVPNGMFSDTMVTNMDRITHRKFESSFQLRYADAPKVAEILQGIKAALKDVPNIDLLSPFRVHLVDFAESGLKINVVCYFATKSFDEFLYLQQVALLEVTRVVQGANATMTSVLYVDMNNPAPIGKVPLAGMINSAQNKGVAQSGLPKAVASPPKDLNPKGAEGAAKEEDDPRPINGTGVSGGSSVQKSRRVKKPRGGTV
ncbi:unnamed protein product [Ectocarpus sp. 12 AP-2014]